MSGWKKDTVNLLRRIGLKRRLFLSFLLISVVPMTLLGVFMGKKLYDTIMDHYEAQSVQILNNLEYRMTGKLNQNAKMINDFASDLDIVKSVTKLNRETDTLGRTILVKQVQASLLADLNKGQTGMRSEILDQTGGYVTGIFEDHYQTVVEKARETAVESGERLHIAHLSGSLPLISEQGDDIALIRSEQEKSSTFLNTDHHLVYSRQIINYFSGNTAGWVLMYLDTNELEEVIGDVRSDVLTVIYDENGEVVCLGGREDSFGTAEDSDILRAGLYIRNHAASEGIWKSDWKIGGERYQLLFCRLKTGNFQLAIFQNYRELRRSFGDVGLLIMTLVPFSIGIILFMSYLITGTVAEPIGNIVRQMQQFSSGLLSVRVEDTSGDEIGVLGQEFNAMSNNIERLTREVYESRIKEKEASLRALEAQINPHFLYNTLDMINWMSFRTSNKEVCEIVRALSDFFRLSLNNGKELYTVQDEMKHVKSYITIERYKMSQIQFHMWVEEGLESCVCPKLIVQPLVENAIRHGIEAGKGYGNIEISCTEADGELLLQVMDDGAGLNGKAEADAKYHKGGYGLLNINERLHMLYGKAYQVTVMQRAEGGVVSRIRIPKIETRGCQNETDDSGR